VFRIRSRQHIAALLASTMVCMPASTTVMAQAAMLDADRTETVRFARGATSATLSGRVSGYEAVDYVLSARRGQQMTVSLTTPHRFVYFTVLPPGGAAAPDGGSITRNYSGELTASGEWRVRVYLMRNAARRGEYADYRLTTSIR
jgi:hypothetical protein